MTSGPCFSSLKTALATSIIASLKNAPSEKAFLFFIKKYAALNDASVAFWDFFTGLIKKVCCLSKAAFHLQAFYVLNVLASG